MILRSILFGVLALVIALESAAAQEPAWSLEVSDLHGADGVTETYAFRPGLLVGTLRGDSNQAAHELVRRSLTNAENAIVQDAILQFSKADLRPRYEDPNMNDGCEITVALVAPDGSKHRVEVHNILVPELEALARSLAPLLPPAAALNHYPPDLVRRP